MARARSTGFAVKKPVLSRALISIHSLRTTRRHDVRIDEGEEPAVRYRTAEVIPASRYEVLLVSSPAWCRLRGRHRMSPAEI